MIADHFLQLRTDVEAALIGLLRLVAEIKQGTATADTLHGLLANIREPLLFVVVGEVKSGKSSLLNALFGREFAKADVLPATDKICIFRYGKEEKTVDVSSQLIARYFRCFRSPGSAGADEERGQRKALAGKSIRSARGTDQSDCDGFERGHVEVEIGVADRANRLG